MRDLRTAQKLKAMGTLAGVPDLQFHWAEPSPNSRRPLRRVLWLELKVGNRKLSDAQAAFALAARLLGDEFHVATTIDEACAILGARSLFRPGIEVCGRRW